MTLDRLAFGTLVLLALCVGLGDIASVTAVDALLLMGVRGLLPLAIALGLLATLRRRRLPAFPGRLALPMAAWLSVLVTSAALAPSNRLEAFVSLERPASGALLAWAVYSLCRTRARWRLLAKAAALSGLAIALAGLAEASGIPTARDWLAALHDGAVPIGDVPRIASTLSHPNEAAMLLELSLPLLVAWAWTASRRWRVPLALAAAGNLVAMVLTFSRAGVVAGMAGLAVMAGLCVVRGERRPLLSLSAAALAVPAALICAAMADQGLDRRLTAELSQDSTVSALPVSALSSALSAQPRWVIAAPESVTAQPAGVTAQRTGITAQPEGATTQPAGVIAPPESVTAQLAGVTPQVESVTAQPAGLVAPPESGTAQLAGVTPQSESVTPQPAGVTAQRTGVTAQPEGVTAQPAGLVAPPERGTAQPAGVTRQPESITAQRTGVTAHPEGDTTQPAGVIAPPESVAAQPAGVTRQPESVIAQLEGVAPQSQSVTAQPEGVTPQVESVTPQPEGVTAQRTGVTPPPEGVTAPPTGVTTQPESVTAQPEGIIAQPAGGTAQPSRMEFWTAALDMARDHPWLGVGPDNFRWRFASYSGIPADNLGIHAHDQYLEALADTGVLGLLTLGWLLVRLVRTALDGVGRATVSADWPWRAAILASLSAWLLHALLDDFERFWPASVAFWLLAGLNLRLPDQPPTPRRDPPRTSRAKSNKPRATALAVGALLIALGTECSQAGSPTSAYPTINGISCDTSEKVAFHIHAHLAIFANGQPVTVPYGIGIGKPWQIQQSTEHTEDGVIHIESPVQRTFTLGDFFAIWGQPLSTSQVATAQGPVIAYVNGERTSGDPNAVPLQAHELIQLDVGQDVPPEPFTFPPGL